MRKLQQNIHATVEPLYSYLKGLDKKKNPYYGNFTKEQKACFKREKNLTEVDLYQEDCSQSQGGIFFSELRYQSSPRTLIEMNMQGMYL